MYKNNWWYNYSAHVGDINLFKPMPVADWKRK